MQLDGTLNYSFILTELGDPGNGAGFIELFNAAPRPLDLSDGVLQLACWGEDGTLHAVEDLKKCGMVQSGQCCVLLSLIHI